jgi:predicted nucleic acid-binding protein
LPVCRDPEDQKFLELANDCAAHFLVTRDRALLVLGRRKVQPLSFRIVTPEEFGD